MNVKKAFFQKNWLILIVIGSLLLGSPLFLSGIITRLSTKEQLFFAWGLICVVLVLRRVAHHFSVFFGILISFCTLFLLGRYFFFRLSSTLLYTSPLEFFFILVLFAAELYGMFIQVMGMIVNVMPLYRPTLQSIDLTDPDLPVVDVLIPTYNEPEQMVAITASACTLFDYPREKLNIYILDDGGTIQKRNSTDPESASAALVRHETLNALAEYLEVNYLTREENTAAKAGNINAALYKTVDGQKHPNGDLVLVLDCDHVPTRDFLQNTVGYFLKDPKLFLVQTPHFFINPDPVEKNLDTFNKIPGDNVMFYGKVLPGLDLWNAAFFCGSAAVLRRSCLDDVGGIVGETITEDAETALTMHGRGYNSVYVGKPMVCGLCPETFEDFIIQRNRWAQGMAQILLLKNPLFVRGLSLIQRLCYLNSAGFWFFSFSRLMFMLAPFFYLYGGMQIYHATLLQCLAYPIPYMILSMIVTNFMYGSVRHPFFSELYETAMSFYNVPAILSVLRNPRSPQFKVTPKDTSLAEDSVSPLVTPFYIMLGLFAAMYPVALFRAVANPQLLGSIVICTVWGTFNLLLLLLCLGVVWEKRQIRKKYRMPVKEPILLRAQNSGESGWLKGLATDLSEEGMGIILDGETSFSEHTMIEIKTENSAGRHFLFTAEIIRIMEHGNGVQLGCQYEYEDEESFLAITNYLYGESDRWEKLWKARQHKVPIIAGFFFVLKLGFTGTYHHFRGLTRICWKKIHIYQEKIWSKFVARKTKRSGYSS